MKIQRKLPGIGVLVVVIGTLLAATTSIAGAEHSGMPDQLILSIDDTGAEFRYNDGTPQSITENRCAVTNGSGNLVNLDGFDNEKIGLLNLGIGIKAKGSGTDCGLVDKGDGTLVIKLSDDPTSPLRDKEFDSADLDLEGKGLVVVRAEFLLDGIRVGVFCAATDPAVDESTFDCDGDPATDDAYRTQPFALGADSGPDARDGDNFNWVIPYEVDQVGSFGFGAADELRLTVHPASNKSGAFSLKGGGDGGTTATSKFTITDVAGVLNCDDTVSATDNGLSGQFTRLNTETVSSGCSTAKVYNLAVDGGVVQFVPEAAVFAIYRGELTFPPVTATNPPTSRTLEYDRDGEGDAGFVDMQICNVRTADASEVGLFPELDDRGPLDASGDPTDGFPTLEGLYQEQPPNTGPDGGTLGPFAPTSCVVAVSASAINTHVQAGGTYSSETQEVWVVYLEGDPFYRG